MNYVNGKFVVEPFSEGQLYGMGVFETILVEDGKGEYLQEHFERLVEGAKVLDINFNMSYISFQKHINKFIERSSKGRYAMRVSVAKKAYTYDFMINERRVPYTQEDYGRGFKVRVGELLKNPTSPLTYIKSICYTDNLLSLKKARIEGYDEVLHLNYKGEVCEGAISNIFFVRDGVVRTPHTSCGILKGIMREKIMERLRGLGIEVEEGSYSLEEVLGAQEIFVTNSLMGLMPVTEIEGKRKNSRSIYELIGRNI
ncbi:branched chain amino acid--2-keto-4-methylthiobutyrate aminotransferase [Propionigenium maris DSM 9537]|uniref:Branched chain amino acid--2-keto-4-methylthiobutyrate aminotransferase n=1 Tax=Propionigenium maris DSM 9537 TaxID=1123000 RepID=A0A9W6LNM5_9FUSO|nr:aminotransferase class IV [Propionigenium maris]GLI57049.1 branched chain amino acid--2-keto-4-methylthiobutyrate aminotransferase [Propionigenium maris DSM 9537]